MQMRSKYTLKHIQLLTIYAADGISTAAALLRHLNLQESGSKLLTWQEYVSSAMSKGR